MVFTMPEISTETNQSNEISAHKHPREKYVFISLVIIIILIGFFYTFRTSIFGQINPTPINKQNYTTIPANSNVSTQKSYGLPTSIYVATLGNNIIVFNAATYMPVQTIAINASKLKSTSIAMYSITLSPSGKELYLVGTKNGNNTVTRALIAINSTTGSLINSINLNMYVSGLVLSSNGGDAFILGSPTTSNGFPEIAQNTTIYKINLTSGNLIKNITFNGIAYNEQIVISENDTKAYVSDRISGKIKTIDLSTGFLINSVSVRSQISYIFVDPKANTAYVSHYSSSNTLSVINLSTGSVNKIINVGTQSVTVAFSPSGDFAYVANYGSNSISVINTATNNVIKTIPVNYPLGIAVK